MVTRGDAGERKPSPRSATLIVEQALIFGPVVAERRLNIVGELSAGWGTPNIGERTTHLRSDAEFGQPFPKPYRPSRSTIIALVSLIYPQNVGSRKHIGESVKALCQNALCQGIRWRGRRERDPTRLCVRSGVGCQVEATNGPATTSRPRKEPGTNPRPAQLHGMSEVTCEPPAPEALRTSPTFQTQTPCSEGTKRGRRSTKATATGDMARLCNGTKPQVRLRVRARVSLACWRPVMVESAPGCQSRGRKQWGRSRRVG